MTRTAKREFKDALFGEFARIGRALASARRLEIVELLAQGERTVEAVAAETAQPVANASQHLQVLLRARLVASRREGKFVRYRLAGEGVVRLWLALREAGESQLGEVRRLAGEYMGSNEGARAIDCAGLARRIKSGRTVVLDVRPACEYESGHIAGARSIPIGELSRRMKELPKSRAIVAYCRGPYCVFAGDAAALLASKGFRVLRLDGGFPDWEAAGGAVERAA